MNNLGQDWFFGSTTEGNTLFINEDTNTVGINDSTPQYDLEVNDTIRTSNLLADNVSACNLLQGISIDAKSNLLWGGHSLYDPYPQDPNDWDDLIPFSGDNEGMIHHSWLRKPLSGKDVLTDLWNLADAGFDVAEGIMDAISFFQGASNALTEGAIQAIQDLLENALDSSNSSLAVEWANLKNKPLARNNYNVGLRGDLFMTSNTKLRALSTSLSIDQWGNPQFIGNPTGATLIDFGSREGFLKYLTLSNTDTTTLYTADEIIPTSSNFKLYDFRFSSNTIINSQSNIVINGVTLCNDALDESVAEADKFYASRYVAPQGRGSALTFFTSQTTLKHQNTTPSNPLDWRMSQVVLTDREIKYEKFASTNEGGGQTTLFQVNSNGELYLYSNIRANSPFTIRAIEQSIDDFPREALFFMNSTNFRWIRRKIVNNSNDDTITASFSSNGLLLGERPAFFGKNEGIILNPLLPENFIVKFPRLEYSFSNGLTYGYGFSNNPLQGDFDIFNVSYKGEIKTLNHQNFLMKQVLNSNADLTTNLVVNNRTSLTSNGLTISNLIINSNGAILYNGKEFLNEAGSLRMRTYTDPSCNQGLNISTSGFIGINGSDFQITNEGVMTIRQPLTASNISTSNLTCTSNLSASNITASNAVLSNLRVNNRAVVVNNNGADFVASNSTQSNCQFTFINEQGVAKSYLYINPVHNLGGGNPYTNVGVYSYSNGLDQGLGRLNLQGTVLYNFTRLEDQFAPSNTLSNYATSNALSNLNSNLLTYSNWVNTQYAPSNQLSNFVFASNTAVWTSNNFSNVATNTSSAFGSNTSAWTSNFAVTLSNWTDATFRKKSVQVPWADISGKPDFSVDSNGNGAMSIGGLLLSGAGIVLGGLALYNQYGQVASTLEAANGAFKLDPNGTNQFNRQVEIKDNLGNTNIQLDPAGSLSALTGSFKYSQFTDAVKVGLLSLTLSNDQIIWTSNNTSNAVLGSNSLTIRNNTPFTFSNANVLFTCNVGVGTTSPQEQIDATGAIRCPQFLQIDEGAYHGSGWKYVVNAWSNYTPKGGYVIRHGGSNQNFQLFTGSNTLTQQFTVLANGFVGVGTNAPTTRLSVAGDVLCSNLTLSNISTSNLTVASNIISSNLTSSNITVASRVTTSNISIGTTNTISRLTIGSAIDALTMIGTTAMNMTLSNALAKVEIALANANNDYSTSANGGDMVIRNSRATGRIHIQNGQNTTGVTVNSNNFIGVGTNAPLYRLDVAGDARCSNLTLGLSNVFARLNVALNGTAGVGGSFAWFGYSNESQILSLIDQTSTGSRPAGLISFVNAGLGLYGKGGPVRFFNFADAETMRITNDGRLGIGTTTPSYTLDVNGGINTSQLLYENTVPLINKYAFSNTVTTLQTQTNNLSNAYYTSSNSFADRYWTFSNSAVSTTSNVYVNALTSSNLLIASGIPNAGMMGIRHNAIANTGIGFTSTGMLYTQVNNGQGWEVRNSNAETLFSVYDIAGINAYREAYNFSNVYNYRSTFITACNFLEFGNGLTKETNAGRIAYGRFGASNYLDIIGAGTTGNPRLVRVYDILNIDSGIIQGRNRTSPLLIDNFGFGGAMALGHSNLVGTSAYALLQTSSGETTLNSALGTRMFFSINNSIAMTLSNGSLGVGTTTPSSRLHISDGTMTMNSNGTTLTITPTLITQVGGGNRRAVIYDITPYTLGSYECIHSFTNSVSVKDDFNATTKNFKIIHPLDPAKNLIHACVEAPRADLMYSGTVKLNKGKAIVSIDTASCPKSPMKIGTFEALTRNPRVYLQNNDGWTAVKGKVVGGTLEIEAQSKGSDDEIQWLIIAERKDEGIMRSRTTNDEGYLMTEVDF